VPLSQTLQDLEKITKAVNHPDNVNPKPIIVSITGSVEELKACLYQITQARPLINAPLYVEINLSCPNIMGKPPPAFGTEGLTEYLTCLRDFNSSHDKLGPKDATASNVRFGIKTPPYSNPENFQVLQQALLKLVVNDILEIPLQFITATNTLGCSLVLNRNCVPLVSSEDGSGIGGMAGAPLHALSLGNVHIIRSILKSHKALQHVQVIGVGGVNDGDGMRRMRSAGADFVGVGTALAMKGVKVFDEILSG
jgi:dihydroorotate dehydrogenase (fumarate)